jgi:hypothetical protein
MKLDSRLHSLPSISDRPLFLRSALLKIDRFSTSATPSPAGHLRHRKKGILETRLSAPAEGKLLRVPDPLKPRALACAQQAAITSSTYACQVEGGSARYAITKDESQPCEGHPPLTNCGPSCG